MSGPAGRGVLLLRRLLVAVLRLRHMPQSRLRALCAASLSDRIRLIDSIDKSALEPLVHDVETAQSEREQACNSNNITEEKSALALEIDLGLEAIAAGISSVPAEDRSLSIGALLLWVGSVLSREKVPRSWLGLGLGLGIGIGLGLGSGLGLANSGPLAGEGGPLQCAEWEHGAAERGPRRDLVRERGHLSAARLLRIERHRAEAREAGHGWCVVVALLYIPRRAGRADRRGSA